MLCLRCHAESREESRFCEDCGARLAQTCAHCGGDLTAGKKFCGSCGAAVDARPPERFVSPESYTPMHLAEKIRVSRDALQGERKQVTVLFADLKGSMELLADRDPEEARQLLDGVLERMIAAVHRYEGTVNQVMGDGIMALFGAPVAHEDHAVRACYAALDLQSAMRRHTAEVRRSHGVEILVRVGLNSGEVVVRAIRSDLQMDYAAVGQTTHLAARMEQLAVPGTIRLTAATLRLAEGYIRVNPLGAVPVKGLERPVEVYELAAAAPVRSRVHAAASRGLTRFVGREGELRQLQHALGEAGEGHGQVLAVIGEAGVGKSRLVWEITHSHRIHHGLVLEAGAVSYGKATPYLPVIDLLKAYFHIEARDGARQIGEKVIGKLLGLDRALEPSVPALLALLDVPVDDAQWQVLDPPQRRRRTLDAVKRVFLRESRVQPVLLVFEDLHWIDAESQALLDALVESLPAASMLLLVNYRPEYRHSWGSRTYYLQLRLDPLPPKTADELLQILLGAEPALGVLKELLIARTQGNPFFLEESVRALVETGALEGAPGAYRLVRPVPAVDVPATVHAVIAERIDRLPPGERALLQTASVLGTDVPFALLQAVAGLSENDLRHHLTRLQAGEFLYETRLFPDLEFTFKHALTHDVAYGTLLHEHRRALHAAVVDAIERLYPDALTEHVERLADHSSHGEMWDKAVTYLRQAGAKSAARSAYREATGWFEQALAALSRLPERRETMELAVDLRLDLRNALHPLGEFERTLVPLREAETLAQTLGDQPRLGRVSASLSQYFRLIEAPDRAVDSGQRALAIAGALGDFTLQIVSNVSLGQAYRARGDYRRALEPLRRNVAALDDARLYDRFGQAGLPSVLSRTWLARCLAELGELAEATTCADEALRIAETVDHPNTLVHAYFGVGMVRFHRGDFANAIVVLERGMRLHEQWQLDSWFPALASALGSAYAWSGRVGDAVALLEKAVAQATGMKLMGRQSFRIAELSRACLLDGHIDRATDLAARALALARENRERGNEAWALRLAGDVASARMPPDGAGGEAHYREALALADELGMRPLVAHCHLGLGALRRRIDDGAEAGKHLATAANLYREMDMAFWLERAAALGPS